MKLIHSEQLPEPFGHYSHAVTVAGWVFVSGLLPYRKDSVSGEVILPDTPEEQADQILLNLEQVLAESGAPLQALAQVRFYVPDTQHRKILEPIYAAKLGEHRPARVMVPCGALREGACFMLEAVAYQSVE